MTRHPLLLIVLVTIGLVLACRYSAVAAESGPGAVANVTVPPLAQSGSSTFATIEPLSLPEPSPQAIRRYHSGNVLWVIATLWGFVVPGVIFFSGLSARLRDRARRLQPRWYLTFLLYLVFLTYIIFLADLPLDYYTDFVWQHEYGISAQTFGKWSKDELLTLTIDIIGFALVLWIPFLLLKRTPSRWWLYTWVASIPIMVFMAFVQPIWVDPLFNHFGPMHDQALESKILQLASRAGIEGAKVYEVNKSVDTNMVNAYVTGIGSTKRIVLWDTTLKAFSPDEVALVMSHEMGHYRLRHSWEDLILQSLAMLAGLAFIHISAGWILRHFSARSGVHELGDVASLPLFMLLFNLVIFVLMPPLLAVSRHDEHEADRFALEMTHDSRSCGGVAVKFMELTLAYPNPSPIVIFFRASHPPLSERLAFCNTYQPWRQGQAERYSRYFNP